MTNQYPPGGYGPQGYPAHPPHNPPPNRTAQILAITAAVVALIAAGVVIYLFLRPTDKPEAQPPTSVVTVTSNQQVPEQPGQGTVPPPATTTTITTTTESGSIPVNGADRHGFHSGPNCDAAEDPAVFVGYTSRSRVVICQVGSQTGRYYYKGLAGGNTIHIDYPTRTGSTFTAVNRSTSYIVSPSSLVITENGRTLANEPMIQSWLR